MKHLSLVLILMFFCSLYAQTAAPPSGAGTASSPYLIANLDNLYWLSQNPGEWDKYYEQTAGIDASPTSAWNAGKGFLPLGNRTTNFTGYYNGKEKSIDGLTIYLPDETCIGLFGITLGASISNLNLTNINIEAESDIGGLVGNAENTLISNCHTSGNIISDKNYDYSDRNGGLVGYCFGTSEITSSSSSCSVLGKGGIGGLVGICSGDATVTNSFAIGSVEGKYSTGGFVGSMEGNSSISSSYSTSSVEGFGWGGGFIGFSKDSPAIQNCYAKGDVVRTAGNSFTQFGGFCGSACAGLVIDKCYSIGNVSYDGDIDPTDKGFLGDGIGILSNNFWNYEVSNQTNNSAGGATGKSSLEMYKNSTFTKETTNGLTNAWDFETNPHDDINNENHWDIDSYNRIQNDGFPFLSWENRSDISMNNKPSGSGTTNDPYLIAVLKDLKWLYISSEHWDKVFEQTADIDASETSTWYSGEGFLPIGDEDIQFTGSYDGKGFSITDLFITRTDVNYSGLFGYVIDAVLKNIYLENVNINITNNNSQFTGSLGGRFDNTSVSNCHSSGTVDGNNSGSIGGLIGLCGINSEVILCSSSCTVIGGNTVGGLIGQLFQSNLSKSYTSGNVTAKKESSNGSHVGGLVGISNEGSNISLCYSKNTVEGYSQIGGLIGWNYDNSIVENCYSTGNVYRTTEDDTKIGGFCGGNTSGTIKNCYSTGSVHYRNGADPTDKGFLGNNNNGVYENNFWDMEVSNQSSNSAGGATGKTTVEMKKIDTFTDETTIGLTSAWDFEYNFNNDQINEEFWDMDNVNKIINSGYPFLSWENNNDISVVITISGSGSSEDPYLISELNDLRWMILNPDGWDKIYTQTANIEAAQTSTWYSNKGFNPIGNNNNKFTGSYDGNNFSINGLTISRIDEQYIGLFGYIYNGEIKNLKLTDVDIQGYSNVGALAGQFRGNVTNCHSSGDIVCNNYFGGGLIGRYERGDMNNCSSNCSIIGYNSVGGLVGENGASNTISNSFAAGSINGNNNSGGFIGAIYDPITISCCYSKTVVNGKSNIGGFVGYIFQGSIKNCYCTGDVIRSSESNSDYVGGFCGNFDSQGEGYITDCYSTSKVSYENANNPLDKGFYGYKSSYIEYSENNFWAIETSGQTSNSEGGATGKTTAEMKTLATFTDETTSGLTTAWDFETNPNDDNADENHWDIDRSGVFNDGYPFLAWENGTGEDDISLPVELSSFTAKLNNNVVTLSWTTASEMNNRGFNVYRSMKNEEIFVKLNKSMIEGAINSSSAKSYQFIDTEIIAGNTYYYKLENISTDGKSEMHNAISIQTEQTENLVADTYSLSNAYPNPFNPTTHIKYSIPENSFVNIIIYDNRGNIVHTLVNKNQSTGYYDISWDASGMPSGIYFYKITAGKFSKVKKCLLVK